MRRVAICIVAIFLLPQWLTLVSGDVSADGDLSDWRPETLMATDSSAVSLHLDWNSTHLMIAWNGTAWASETEGADLFVYLNTSEDGGALSKEWNLAHTLPFLGDFAFVLEDSNYFDLLSWSGTTWESVVGHGIDAWIGWEENRVSEISIPLQSIGSPDSFGLVAWAQWQDEGNVWTSFPLENPASSNAAETFTHYYQLELNSSDPSSSEVVKDERGFVKVDDALNLAIIFHQHQPYYKNMLTGKYEMPWVRVHAMTEYVDSPGILAQSPGTKVVYNLVPSFMEQLIDYHENETLDVHTDWARRPWPVDETGAVTGYPEMSELELHTMQFQSFWNSGWIYNVSADDEVLGWLYPASSAYKSLHSRTLHNLKPATIMDDELLPPQDLLDLQVLWHLFQLSPYYVQGNYSELGDPESDSRPSHRNDSIVALFEQGSGFTFDDLQDVLDYQHQQMANVLPMYSDLAASGQVELTTTPYYHPILPLLMKPGWTEEDGITVRKDAWPDDTAEHLQRGMDMFTSHMGFRPTGMWPSEQSTSPAMIQPLVDAGVDWFVTDEENLARSTMSDGSHPNPEDATVLASPWTVTGEDGGEITAFFRDRVISDRIAFQYGSMTPEAAVSDFIAHIDGVRQELIDAGEDPSNHILTVALDGENWMFMSEFQHHDGARPFMQEWYSRLESHPTIRTMTPSEFLEDNQATQSIDVINEGSWIDGTLSTWAGEEEESLAWQRLVEARKALVAFEADNPTHSGLTSAWESLYIAEGSDWFWWYGLDQDSGYDELWDTLFKVHLSNIYKAVGLDLPPYLLDLWTNPAPFDTPYGGVMQPMIDGLALPGEWDDAARYDASNMNGVPMDITSFHVGYDSSNLHLRVDMPDALPEELLSWESGEPDLSIYFMQSNAINFNEVETNFRTYYGNEILGFPAKYMVSFDFSELRDDGRAKWNLFEAKGKVGDNEKWVYSSSSTLGGCAAQDVYEFSIPWSEVGLAPRYTTRLKVVTSIADSTAQGDGTELEMAPGAPAEVVLPDLEEWITLLDLDDETGDADRDGAITAPLASDFAADGNLWDIQNVKIHQSSWNARFELQVEDITNIWSMSNGFSHQIVQIYVDQGPTSYGRTEMLEGANAVVHDDWAWEVAISATGEPGAVKAVIAETGETLARGIEVSADSDSEVISITVNKDVLGSDVADYRYVIVLGSQDGFGPGKWRDVDDQAGTWRLGGGADPSSVDGIDYDPNILDMLTEDGVSQNAMLSDYSVSEQRYAVLTGIEIPELAQQVFGAMVDGITANSAIITFQTTREATAQVACGDASVSSSASTNHQVSISGLATGTAYNCNISVEGVDPISLAFNTSSEIDETPPEILNILSVVDESGRVMISWYTSEKASERVTLTKGGTEIVLEGSALALDKNHFLTSEPLTIGTWNLVVEASDASGNSNSSSIQQFEVEESDAVDEGNEQAKSGEVNLFADPVVQVIVLFVVLLTTLAMFRGRKNDRI